MTAYLMTRGTPRRLDYRFVGAAPPDRWWAPLGDWLVLEKAEVVVHSGPDGTDVLVSGIPSARRDSVTTAIRYTLVVDGAAPGLLHGLAAAGLDPEARTALGAALDAQFPADWVDAALGGAANADADAAARLRRALDTVTVDVRPATVAGPASWTGAIDDAAAVAAFLARVAELGSGGAGWAFTTAALSSVEGARRAAAQLDRPVAVLLGSGGPPEVVDLGKAPAGTRAGQQPSRRRRAPLPSLVVVAVVLVMAVATVLLLLR